MHKESHPGKVMTFFSVQKKSETLLRSRESTSLSENTFHPKTLSLFNAIEIFYEINKYYINSFIKLEDPTRRGFTSNGMDYKFMDIFVHH